MWVPAMLGRGYSGIPLLDITTDTVYVGIGADEGFYKMKISDGRHIIYNNLFPFQIRFSGYDSGWFDIQNRLFSQ